MNGFVGWQGKKSKSRPQSVSYILILTRLESSYDALYALRKGPKTAFTVDEGGEKFAMQREFMNRVNISIITHSLLAGYHSGRDRISVAEVGPMMLQLQYEARPSWVCRGEPWREVLVRKGGFPPLVER